MIEKQCLDGNISGVSMNRNGPAFTHVIYADDIMLFAKANCREVTTLDQCLECYCQWSGQLVNQDKSGLIFSKQVLCDRKRAIKHSLLMKLVPQNAIYLGAPLFTSRNRFKDFQFLQDRMESKLKGWRCKTLSWAGRNTLIKSVAQTLPYYTFSSFDVPSKVCDRLDATTRLFWWNPKKVSGNYLAWKSWEHICLPKAWGGLGFRKAKKSNEAFLAKLTWMVISNRKSLCMDALRSKYKVRSDWLGSDPLSLLPKLGRLLKGSKVLLLQVLVSWLVTEQLLIFGKILGYRGSHVSCQSPGLSLIKKALWLHA